MKTFNVIFIILCLLFCFACSPTEETTEDRYQNQQQVDNSDTEKDDIYIFEDTEEDEPIVVQPKEEEPYTFDDQNVTNENQNVLSSKSYYIQLAAFSKEDGAKVYVDVNQNYAQTPLNIFFDETRNLYLVRSNPFITREEAEKLRNELKKQERFKDVFLVTPK